jgi:hypothetical protein
VAARHLSSLDGMLVVSAIKASWQPLTTAAVRVQEVCNLMSYPQFQGRVDIVPIFVREDVVGALDRALSSPLPDVRVRAMEVLLVIVQHDVGAVRARLARPPATLLPQVIDMLLADDATGLPEQARCCAVCVDASDHACFGVFDVVWTLTTSRARLLVFKIV